MLDKAQSTQKSDGIVRSENQDPAATRAPAPARHPERGPGRRHSPGEEAQCLVFSRITNSLASRGCRMTARSRVFAALLGFRETEWSAMVGS